MRLIILATKKPGYKGFREKYFRKHDCFPGYIFKAISLIPDL
jgi:hypothetical protein